MRSTEAAPRGSVFVTIDSTGFTSFHVGTLPFSNG
jgi:hypothetical protein